MRKQFMFCQNVYCCEKTNIMKTKTVQQVELGMRCGNEIKHWSFLFNMYLVCTYTISIFLSLLTLSWTCNNAQQRMHLMIQLCWQEATCWRIWLLHLYTIVVNDYEVRLSWVQLVVIIYRPSALQLLWVAQHLLLLQPFLSSNNGSLSSSFSRQFKCQSRRCGSGSGDRGEKLSSNLNKKLLILNLEQQYNVPFE